MKINLSNMKISFYAEYLINFREHLIKLKNFSKASVSGKLLKIFFDKIRHKNR